MFLFQAWDVILQETENLMKLLKANADHLQSITLEILNELIIDKKLARKKYLDDRSRLDSEFVKVCH